MIVDSHCHLHFLDLSEFHHDMDEVLAQAKQNEVEHLLCVCVELADYPKLEQLAERYKQISISVGVHPNTEMDVPVTADMLIRLAVNPACIAIGETGLDYYRMDDEASKTMQHARFRSHIQASIATQKPLIIHTRNAADDTLALMREENAQKIGGVMHCFVEDLDVALQAIELGFYISFSGIVTFKNATTLHEVAKKIPLDRLLIETDSPYLAPVPYRGKQNHPALVKYVAQSLAQLRGISYDELAKASTENFYRCFRFNIK